MPLLVLMLLVALSGCATLDVHIDVLDPGHVKAEVEEEHLRQLLRTMEGGSEVTRLYGDLASAIKQVANAMRAVADNSSTRKEDRDVLLVAADDLEEAVKTGTPEVSAQQAAEQLATIAVQVQEQLKKVKWDGRARIPEAVRPLVLAYRSVLAAYQRQIETELTSLRQSLAKLEGAASSSPSAAPAVTQATAAVAQVGTSARRFAIQGGELTNTEFAYAVAQAPDELWADKFNEAVGKGRMGNTDVVVTLNTAGDFSVKGMRFDASTVAAVAAKVMTQAVLLGTQIAGVPVAKGAASAGDSAALQAASGQLGEDQKVMAARDASLEAQKNAMRAAAQAILAAKTGLTDTAIKASWSTTGTSVTKPVQVAIKALKPLLTLDDLK